jgi:hypothetical protein
VFDTAVRSREQNYGLDDSGSHSFFGTCSAASRHEIVSRKMYPLYNAKSYSTLKPAIFRFARSVLDFEKRPSNSGEAARVSADVVRVVCSGATSFGQDEGGSWVIRQIRAFFEQFQRRGREGLTERILWQHMFQLPIWSGRTPLKVQPRPLLTKNRERSWFLCVHVRARDRLLTSAPAVQCIADCALSRRYGASHVSA